MKKSIAIILMFVTIMFFTPITAFAATHTVGNGDTLDIGTGVLTHSDNTTQTLTISVGDTIDVASGATTEITGTKNVMISCGAGVTLTINDLFTDVSGTDGACALSFIGTGNTLILEGTSSLKSGNNEPGIRVEDPTQLIIDESINGGTVTAIGGSEGAGIGGDPMGNGGTVTINGGNITATGGDFGAGIGGGFPGDGGTININGGSVTATGGKEAAGIGGGFQSSGGTITINDGTVTAIGGDDGAGIGVGKYGDGGIIDVKGGTITATGGAGAAGIGGGYHSVCGDITINDGTVSATGGEYGAGIGGGNESACGRITINDGTVTATGGDYAAGIGGGHADRGGVITINGGIITATGDAGISCKDHGAVAEITIDGGTVYAAGFFPNKDICIEGGSLSIGGDAAIFLYNDNCSIPITTTHTHEIITDVESNMVYGISANGWAPDFGIYMNLSTLNYNANLGTGTLPSDVKHVTGNVIIAGDNTDLKRASYINRGWNTKKDGTGTSYKEGDEITLSGDITLYIKWEEINVNLSSHSETMYPYDKITLTAYTNAIDSSIAWASSDMSIATVDSSGVVTAVSKGNAVITATTEKRSDTCEITVKEKVVEAEVVNTIHRVSKKSNAPSKMVAKVEEAPVLDEVSEDQDETEIITKEGTIIPTSVEENDDFFIVEIKVSDLPEGTTAIELSNGKAIKITENDTIKFEVLKAELDEDGNIEITAVNEENAPLGIYEIHVFDEDGGLPIIPIVIVVVILGVAIYLIRRRRI